MNHWKKVVKIRKRDERKVREENEAKHKGSRRADDDEPRGARAINSAIIPSKHSHYYSHSIKFAINVIRVLYAGDSSAVWEKNTILMGRGSNSNIGFNDRGKKQRLVLIVTQQHSYFSTSADVSVSNKGYRCRETNGRTGDASSFLRCTRRWRECRLGLAGRGNRSIM